MGKSKRCYCIPVYVVCEQDVAKELHRRIDEVVKSFREAERVVSAHTDLFEDRLGWRREWGEDDQVGVEAAPAAYREIQIVLD